MRTRFVIIAIVVSSTPLSTAEAQAQRSNERVYASSQSNAPEDLRMTAEIRRSLLSDRALSVLAHNIGIVTDKGTVTLSGRVSSEQEKRTVEEIASKHAQGARLVSRLEVSNKG